MNKLQTEEFWKITYLEVLKCICTNPSFSRQEVRDDANDIAFKLANQFLVDYQTFTGTFKKTEKPVAKKGKLKQDFDNG